MHNLNVHPHWHKTLSASPPLAPAPPTLAGGAQASRAVSTGSRVHVNQVSGWQDVSEIPRPGAQASRAQCSADFGISVEQ